MKANQDRIILDLRSFMMPASAFADLVVAFSVNSTPSFCDAYLVVREHGGVTPKFWKVRLQADSTCHTFGSQELVGFDPGKCSISVAVDRDITCYVGVTLKDLPAAVSAGANGFIFNNTFTSSKSGSVYDPATWGMPSVIQTSSNVTIGDASTEAKQEPECKCPSLIFGHHRDCEYAKRIK
jgi:hypothetical protein